MVRISSTGNETFSSGKGNLTDVKNQLYISVGFSCTNGFISLYIMVAMIIYGCKSYYVSGKNTGGKPSKRRDAAVINVMTTVVTLSVLVYMIIEMHVLWRMKDSFCYQYRLTNTICTTVGLFSVYFVLWYRLHTVFYLNPILQQTTSKLVFILNKLTVVLLVCMTAINIVTFLCSPHYVTTPFGCVNVHKTEEALLKWFLLLSSTAFFQALLFFSLVYPLRRHRQEMLNCGVRPIFLKPIVKRAIIVACICLISDALNVVYALTNQEKTIYIAHVVYGTNMLINMLALLMSFTDWKQRLFPWNFASIATASPRPNLTL